MYRALSMSVLLQRLALCAQSFPADSRAFSEADDKELIQAVCSGRTESGGKVACGKYCPQGAGLSQGAGDFDWSLVRVTQGHFLSKTSDDAVIATDGCEPHSNNYGGSVLLTRKAGEWTMLWYRGGVETRQCHKVQLISARDILVCMGEYGAQGNIYKDLYVEDLLEPSGSLMAAKSPGFFSIEDNTINCGFYDRREGWPFLKYAAIEAVEFRPSAKGAAAGISVTFARATKKLTSAAGEACAGGPERAQTSSKVSSAAHRYQVDFLFDGRNYKATASGAALIKRLELP